MGFIKKNKTMTNAERQQKFRNKQKELKNIEEKNREMELSYKEDNFIINELATGLKLFEGYIKENLLSGFFKLTPELKDITNQAVPDYIPEEEIRKTQEEKYADMSKNEIIKDISALLISICHYHYGYIHRILSLYKRDILTKAAYDINVNNKRIMNDEEADPLSINDLNSDLLKLNKLYYSLNINIQDAADEVKFQLHPEIENKLTKDIDNSPHYQQDLTPTLFYPYYWGLEKHVDNRVSAIDNFQLYHVNYYVEQCLIYFSLRKEIIQPLLNSENLEKYTRTLSINQSISPFLGSTTKLALTEHSPFYLQDIIFSLFKRIAPKEKDISYPKVLEILINKCNFIDVRSKRSLAKMPEHIKEMALVIALHSHILKTCIIEELSGKQRAKKVNSKIFYSNKSLLQKLKDAYRKYHCEPDVYYIDPATGKKQEPQKIEDFCSFYFKYPLKSLIEEFISYVGRDKSDNKFGGEANETQLLSIFEPFMKVATGVTENFSVVTQPIKEKEKNYELVDSFGFLEDYVFKDKCENEDLFLLSSHFYLFNNSQHETRERTEQSLEKVFPWVVTLRKMFDTEQDKYYWSLLYTVLFIIGKKYSNLLWAKKQFIDKDEFSLLIEEPLFPKIS